MINKTTKKKATKKSTERKTAKRGVDKKIKGIPEFVLTELERDNIFDYRNPDLPPELRDQIKVSNWGRKSLMILNLFDIKKQLTLNEIIVGLYYKERIISKRNSVTCLVNLLKKNNKIKSVERGYYEKI